MNSNGALANMVLPVVSCTRCILQIVRVGAASISHPEGLHTLVELQVQLPASGAIPRWVSDRTCEIIALPPCNNSYLLTMPPQANTSWISESVWSFRVISYNVLADALV